MRLLDNTGACAPNGRTVILSGDVHIGCLGVVIDTSNGAARQIHQVVASGIVHPAPSTFEWLSVLAATNDRIEYLDEDKSMEIDMLKP